MICRHRGITGICGLFNRCREDSLIYDKEGRCITKNYDRCPTAILNCDEEGYCMTGNDEQYPDDSCDNYKT